MTGYVLATDDFTLSQILTCVLGNKSFLQGMNKGPYINYIPRQAGRQVEGYVRYMVKD